MKTRIALRTFGWNGKPRRWATASALLALLFGLTAANCGGGGGGGGGGDVVTPGTGVLTATSGTITHSIPFTIQ